MPLFGPIRQTRSLHLRAMLSQYSCQPLGSQFLIGPSQGPNQHRQKQQWQQQQQHGQMRSKPTRKRRSKFEREITVKASRYHRELSPTTMHLATWRTTAQRPRSKQYRPLQQDPFRSVPFYRNTVGPTQQQPPLFQSQHLATFMTSATSQPRTSLPQRQALLRSRPHPPRPAPTTVSTAPMQPLVLIPDPRYHPSLHPSPCA
jgi:hypothetical protein